jgi:hypothetical protein
MFPLRSVAFLLLSVISFSSFSPVDGCTIMHNGKFKYMADKEPIFVTINDSSFTESYQDGRYYIKAQLDWISQCEYKLIIRKVNAPGTMYTTGDELNVKINHVEGNDIFYTASTKRVSWEGKFTKIE